MDTLLATPIGWCVVVLALPLTLLIAIEVGYRGARYVARDTTEERAQTGTVASALIALLGFLLAFTFGMAEVRFQQRKGLVLEEANAIETTFLRADFLPEPRRARARELLLEYVAVRLDTVQGGGDIDAGVERSKEIHDALWTEGQGAFREAEIPVAVSLFVQALNQTIELHEARVTVSFHHRVPPSVLWTLYLVSLGSLGVLGVHFGLARARTLFASTTLVVLLWAVLVLIVDLDQPRQRLFVVSQQALVDVQQDLREATSVSGSAPAPVQPLPAP